MAKGKSFNIGGVKVLKEDILANDVVFPWESHPHGMKPWLFEVHLGGPWIVWASHEQYALDELADSGLLDGFMADENELKDLTDEEIDETYMRLGNASEPFAVNQNSRIRVIEFKDVPVELMVLWAEARGKGDRDLKDV